MQAVAVNHPGMEGSAERQRVRTAFALYLGLKHLAILLGAEAQGFRGVHFQLLAFSLRRRLPRLIRRIADHHNGDGLERTGFVGD